MKYGEMDRDIQDAVVFGITRRFGVNEESARAYLDRTPEFDPSVLSYMVEGDDTWEGIMREILWPGKTVEEIAEICK